MEVVDNFWSYGPGPESEERLGPVRQQASGERCPVAAQAGLPTVSQLMRPARERGLYLCTPTPPLHAVFARP